MVLSAGVKLIVVERAAADWSKWTTRLELNSTNLVVDVAVLSDDGSVLAYSCHQGVCVSVYNGAWELRCVGCVHGELAACVHRQRW